MWWITKKENALPQYKPRVYTKEHVQLQKYILKYSIPANTVIYLQTNIMYLRYCINHQIQLQTYPVGLLSLSQGYFFNSYTVGLLIAYICVAKIICMTVFIKCTWLL